MPRIESLAKAGYYPTPPKALEMIQERILPPFGRNPDNRTVRLLDPCCGTGDALKSIAKRMETKSRKVIAIHTYGVEVQQERADQAREQLDNLLEADFFRTSIGNGQFSAVLLNPPYDTEAYSSDGRRRTELAYLMRCTAYLASRGTLIFVIPQATLAHTSQYLSSYYNEILCLPFPEDERDRFNQIVVFGQKKQHPFPDHGANRRIAACASIPQSELEQQNPNPDKKYNLPGLPDSGVLFINLELDIAAATTEAREQGVLSNPAMRNAFWPENTEPGRPLMPLRKGHLAQLIAAGFTDNVVLRHEGETILVKGKITKSWDTVSETETRTEKTERLTASVVTLNASTGKIERIQS